MTIATYVIFNIVFLTNFVSLMEIITYIKEKHYQGNPVTAFILIAVTANLDFIIYRNGWPT